MYEINGICYAGKCSEGIKVSDVSILTGGMMLVTFNTGEKRLFDPSMLKGSAFEDLQDENVLKQFKLFHGIITWKNGEIDIAPETVYYESYPYHSAETLALLA